MPHAGHLLADGVLHGDVQRVAQRTAAKKARGQLAPFKAIDSVEAATTLPYEEGCQKEAEYFRECLFSPQSKALIHVFFGERAVSKVPDVPNGGTPPIVFSSHRLMTSSGDINQRLPSHGI